MADDFPILPTSGRALSGADCPLLGGDPEAWIVCCSGRFFPLARRIAGDDALAEDVLQARRGFLWGHRLRGRVDDWRDWWGSCRRCLRLSRVVYSGQVQRKCKEQLQEWIEQLRTVEHLRPLFLQCLRLRDRRPRKVCHALVRFRFYHPASVYGRPFPVECSAGALEARILSEIYLVDSAGVCAPLGV